jgi:hypothetical protein
MPEDRAGLAHTLLGANMGQATEAGRLAAISARE